MDLPFEWIQTKMSGAFFFLCHILTNKQRGWKQKLCVVGGNKHSESKGQTSPLSYIYIVDVLFCEKTGAFMPQSAQRKTGHFLKLRLSSLAKEL